MRNAVFTVDVDRDVNVAEEGRYDAASSPGKTGETAARYTSSARGLELLVNVLDELGIHATFFLEGDTLRALAKHMDVRSLLSKHEVACHGVCHEDLTGETTGVCLTGPEIAEVVRESASIVEDISGRRPSGFRAPYLHASSETLAILAKEGFRYDSSKVKRMEKGRIDPWRLDEGLWELPVAEGKDAKRKRIVSYLWPMHEGERSPSDYVALAESLKAGCLVLATHSWHMVETYGHGLLDEMQVEMNLRNLRRVLEGIAELGIEFRTAGEVVDIMVRDRS